MASSPNPIIKEEMVDTKQQLKNTQSEARMNRIRSAVGRALESPSSAYLLRGSSAKVMSQRKSTLRSKIEETRGTVQDTVSTWSPGSRTEDGEEERDTLKEKLKSFALPLGSI